jgi:DNA-binding transcriptional ArsR family regulator
MPADDTGGGQGVASPDRIDRLLDALSHRRRRHALYELRGADGAVAVADLADAVAADLDAARDRVAASLHHHHVPKLSDAGLVDYDDRSGDVRYAGGDLVSSWLDLLAAVEE